MSAINKNELTEELKKQIEWARRRADWYDPFIEAYDKVLTVVNREELTIKNKVSIGWNEIKINIINLITWDQ